jgi:DNA-3-methyladenine glycosylase II
MHCKERTCFQQVTALVNAIRMIKEDKSIDKQAILAMAEPWRPYRSIATMLFWHYYIQKKNIKTASLK